STLTIDAGQFRQLELVTNGSLDETITWSSADPKVVSVNEDGQIYAVRGGTAVITARTLTGLSASVTVTVSDTPMRTRSGVRNNADGAESYNMLYTGDYSYPGSVICSYIGENADGTITRVAAMNESVTAETYSHDTTELKASKNIEFELPIFGGAFLGSENNFLVFGQENPDESDETEVVRVVKYTKDWTRVSAYSVYGANTYVPFEAGSLKMTECEGRLYIHTCHTMYAGDGDLHHQANMTFIINESDMSLIQSFYSIKNIYQAGYVSHSFDQFIRTDDEHVYRVDHGDAHLRGISITVADLGEDITKVSYILPFPFGSGTTHYNYTGAKVGGFELSTKNMIVAGASIDQENFDLKDPMNIFLSVTKKDFAHSSEPVDTIWLTEYTKDSGVSVSVPRLVKLNEESFLVMWLEETSSGKVTKAVTIDGSGNLTSDIAVIDATVTECQPIYCADGLVRWYGANNTKPVFYALNPYNLTAMEGSATDINIHVHRWEFHFKIEPDCFSSGYTLYYCPDCGEFKQDDYLPPKHSYKSKVIAPTYDSEGYTEHTCTVCGDTYYDNYKPMLPRTSITAATVKLSNATYTGKSLKPAPVVRMNGKTLVKGTDYTVKYSKNLNCGKAVVTISGKGAYTGTKTAGFIIKPAKAKLSAVKSPKTRQVNIAWKKSAGGVTGYQVVIATNSACTSGKKTYTIAKASTTAKTITKLKKGRTYYVKVRAYKTVGKTKYYGAYSTVKSVKCK
ncbi:MAG: fibronectin type III domain-containing protein, partial [Ruminococcus sp.]|nr:fibronectin type III domain-containing protein [Ruminococcus sp.]